MRTRFRTDLAQQAFVAQDGLELAFGDHFGLWQGIAHLGDDPIDQRLHRNVFVGQLLRAGELQEFGDDVSQVASLLENPLRVFGGVAFGSARIICA